MSMDRPDHWDTIYSRRRSNEVSWYQPHLVRSLAFVDAARLSPDAPIIDVGGGDSTLVDDLIARGFVDVTVLDLSAMAIDRSRERLGDRAKGVRWIHGDVTRAELPAERYAFWHDRAVFHFLTDPGDRIRYVAAVRGSLRLDGHIVVATFGPSGPDRCSGLEVVRYDADGLRGEFGGSFEKVGSATETHHTPGGAEQEFVYCYCRKSL